jgi:hypothetical protein
LDQTVELFCGEQKRFSRIADALGYTTFTVDIKPAAKADLTVEIVPASADLMPQHPLIVWASPPDSPTFKNRECWESDGSFYPVTQEAEAAITTIRNVIGTMTALKPTWWFMEHPKSLLRSMPLFAGFNRGYPTRNRHTIRHDEYGGASDEETDVWTNAYWWIPRRREGDGSGGIETGRRVPPMVFSEMLEQLDQYRVTGFYGPR